MPSFWNSCNGRGGQHNRQLVEECYDAQATNNTQLRMQSHVGFQVLMMLGKYLRWALGHLVLYSLSSFVPR